MKEGSIGNIQDGETEPSADIAREQHEAATELTAIDAKLANIQAVLDKWGEPADKDLLYEGRKALVDLQYRLQDTKRPRE